MKQQRKIYQSPLAVRRGEELDIYIVITEVCRETNSVIISYTCPVPEWSQHWKYEEYEFYHPILN